MLSIVFSLQKFFSYSHDESQNQLNPPHQNCHWFFFEVTRSFYENLRWISIIVILSLSTQEHGVYCHLVMSSFMLLNKVSKFFLMVPAYFVLFVPKYF